MNFKLPELNHQHLMLGLFTLFLFQSLVHAYVPLDRIVAIVNDDVIMQSELEKKVRSIRGQLQQQGTQLPPASILERQVLDKMIENRIQLQMAGRTGVKVDDEFLNQTINNIAAENQVSLSQFREILEEDEYNYEQFRENIRNEIKLSQLRKRQVENRIIVTEKEIDIFIANEDFQGTNQTEIKISHILLALPSEATPNEITQVLQVATQVREDLLSGAEFIDTAKSISNGANAENGGDLGWRKLEDVPSLFVDHISDMKKDDISELIQSSSGFHIIKISDIRSDKINIVQQTRSRHILIKPNDLISSEKARYKAALLKTRIESGDDFGLLAKGNSDDPGSAIKGGDLGWTSPGALVPEFQKMMDSIELGEVSKPFKTDYGWHILEVLERREHDNSESIRRGKARFAIKNRKLEEAMQNWTRQLRDEAYVEYRLDEV
ncbi:MAG: molecular chaperone SurA [Legionellales bacterium]|nr:molecular chaperone SurA [Legionellales bacterium]